MAEDAFIYRICGFSELIHHGPVDQKSPRIFCVGCVVLGEAGHGFLLPVTSAPVPVAADIERYALLKVEVRQTHIRQFNARAPPIVLL